jgi:hypothetical protein
MYPLYDISPPNITKDGLGDNAPIWPIISFSTGRFTGPLSESPRLSARKTKRSVSSVAPIPPGCSGLFFFATAEHYGKRKHQHNRDVGKKAFTNLDFNHKRVRHGFSPLIKLETFFSG